MTRMTSDELNDCVTNDLRSSTVPAVGVLIYRVMGFVQKPKE